MEQIGTQWRTDWPKLGPSILIATALIVAIRTAKWSAKTIDDHRLADVDPELDKEIRFAVRITIRVMRELVGRYERLFPGRFEPVYDGVREEDIPR